ncbi:hypothetical protein ACE1TI_14545 [Alteribacillus sp. JSM 102045]|uniref:hypothetical protein n=1 Tax=Alteribacillus sp. JSM 102045 TaxID=1562101 RepID=UPI0035C08A74
MLFFIIMFVAGAAYAGGYYIHKSPEKKKYFIIWGLVSMFVVTPLLSWSISMIVALTAGEGFAGVATI